MKTKLFIPTFLLWFFMFSDGLSSEKEDADNLERLHTEVQKIVSSGWIVDLSLADAKSPDRRGSYPTLIIKSETPLPLEFNFPGAAPGEKPYRVSEPVVIRLIASAFVSPKQHAAIRNVNEQLEQKRLEFERRHLRKIPYAHKGAEPIPPYAYRPKTKEEERVVRVYAFLWLRTELRPLPTHHYQTLSFHMNVQSLMIIRDDQKSNEYHQILEAVQKIVLPYQEP